MDSPSINKVELGNNAAALASPLPYLPKSEDTLVMTKEEGVDVDVKEEYVYPDGGYGWVCLGCCMTLAATTLGFGLSWGVFQAYYVQEGLTDNSSLLGLIGGLNALFSNSVAFVSGRLGDRFGFKPVLYTSAALAWLALFLAGFSTKLWQIIITQGVMSGIGMGIGVPIFFSVPSQWFKKRRGLASGLAVGGSGFGGCICIILLRVMLQHLGAKYTLIIYSFINLGLSLIAILLLRTRPDSPEAQGSGRGPWIDTKVWKKGNIWAFAAALLINPFGYVSCLFYMTQYVDAVAPPPSATLSALPLAIQSLTCGIGRACVGFVADRVGPINTFCAVCLLAGLSQLAIWLPSHTYGAVMGFATIYGLVAPAFISLIPLLAHTIMGPENLASNVGVFLLLVSPGSCGGGPLGGVILGQTRWKWLIVFGGTCQAAAGLLAVAGKLLTNRRPFAKV